MSEGRLCASRSLSLDDVDCWMSGADDFDGWGNSVFLDHGWLWITATIETAEKGGDCFMMPLLTNASSPGASISGIQTRRENWFVMTLLLWVFFYSICSLRGSFPPLPPSPSLFSGLITIITCSQSFFPTSCKSRKPETFWAHLLLCPQCSVLWRHSVNERINMWRKEEGVSLIPLGLVRDVLIRGLCL